VRLRWATAGVVGLGLWLLAAVAVAIGQALVSSANQDSARPWLLSAAVLGLPAIKLLEARSSVGVTCSSGPGRLWPYPPSARRAGLCLVALGALASIGATVLVVLKASDLAATLMWIDGLLAALVGTLLLSPSRPRVSWQFDRRRGIELGLIVGVLMAAFALRWYGLASIPPDVHGDEAAVGLEARRMIAGTLPFAFGFGWSDLPALSFLSRAATLLAFGNNLYGLRVASVIEGVASVAVLFLLARRLWGSRVAVLAAGFLAVAAWHIHFSRTGLQNIQATLFTLLAFYFLAR
jgi:Dolichyl-phosphate-mannose-protein mannosyltransferase